MLNQVFKVSSGLCHSLLRMLSKSVTFLDFQLSQGSVATYCRCSGNLCGVYIENFPRNQLIVVVVSGMQLLRLRSAIRRHHPPQSAVLSQICCFGERKVVLFQILLDGAESRDVGTT